MAILCSNCGTAAADGARFCADCGVSLAAVCPSCGEEVAAGARFCSACGTSLVLEQSGVPSEARKLISVLFADLVGFTAHTEQSDPEDVRARLTRYHEVVRNQVEGHGGRIEKLMGDGVFAVFGVPTAHEDDPERTVRTALRIQEAIGQLNETGVDISVRIAVTTGEAMVQLEDSDREGIVGDVVNTASRLETLAPPGGIVVDQRTYLSSRQAIEFADLDPVSLKGKSEPLAIWQAIGATSRFGVGVEEHDATPFVGRDRELGVLTDAFERVAAGQTIQLVTIAGEPGVGKSRLVREFFAWIDEYPDVVWWRQGRCLPYGEGITFWAIGEVIKAQAGILDGEPPAESAAKLRTTVRVLFEDETDARWIERTLRPLAGVTDTGGAEEQGELFAAARSFFETMAERRPLVLVLEDLHWADDALVGFVEHMLDWATASPILLVCTARPEIFTDHPEWGGGKRNAATISLAPLSDEETALLLAGLMPRHLTDAGGQRHLLERCGGNPLYAIEYARLAAEGGLGDTLPANVEALIAARLDLLGADEKTYLQAAAVVGKVFWAGAVDYMLPDGIRDSSAMLRSLSAREMIRPIRRSSMQGQEEFSFWHVLVRDVAYGQIPRSERARLHETAASWIEAAASERHGDVAELLLHHYGEAIDLLAASGKDRPDLASRAYRFARLAADRARHVDAGKALGYMQRAVALAPGPAERGAAHVVESEIALTAGDLDLCERSARSAVDAFTETGDEVSLAQALSRLSNALWVRGRSDEADAAGRKAVDLVAYRDPHPVVAEVLGHWGAALMLRGREDEARDWTERAHAMARDLGETEGVVRALATLGVLNIRPGNLSGHDMLREVLDLCLDRGLTSRAIPAYNNLATTLQYSDGPDPAIEVIDVAIELADQRGLEGGGMWSRLTRLEHYALAGRLEELDASAEEVVAWDENRGGSQIGSGARAIQAGSRLIKGDVSGARTVFDSALDDARRARDPQVLAPALAMSVAVAHELGVPGDVVELAEEFAEVTSEVYTWRAAFINWIAGPLVEASRLDLLEELTTDTWILGPPGRSRNDAARARLAEARGDGELAVELLEAAIPVADGMRMRIDSVTQRIQLGRCLQALGRDDEAMVALTAARERAAQLGAGLLLSEIDALGGPSPEAAEA